MIDVTDQILRAVCAVSIHSIHAELLRSYELNEIGHVDYECMIWEAVRATSAAPLFFEPITLKASKASFVDGGVRVNNPIEQISHEAELIWPGRSIGCLLSIGTGVMTVKGFDVGKSQLHEVLKTLADIATDAETKARDYQTVNLQGRSLLRAGKYYRFSVPQWISDFDLADFEKVPYMESMTVPYILDHKERLILCAQNLVNPVVAG